MKIILAVMATALVASATASAVTTTLIKSEQIQNGTIRLIDLHPTTKKALKGQRGPQGEVGPAGDQGIEGPRGAGFDLSKITYGIAVGGVLPANGTQVIVASCPAGGKVIGGGGFVSTGHIYGSTPLPGSNAWEIRAQNLGNPSSGTVVPHVVCVLP